MKGRNSKDPVKKAKTLVKDKVQLAPNYDAKKQTGMESAKAPIGKRPSR